MSTPFLGEIRLLPYTFAPQGWADCDGRLLSISDNDALFVLLGTTYGGDGQSTFAVPDLRGRVPVHQGSGAGLTMRVLGELGGSEEVTLLAAQMPAHSHSFNATSGSANASTPAANNELGSVVSDTLYTDDVIGLTGIPTAPTMLTPQGGNQPHTNVMPTLVVRFCIATAGIFPSRN